MFNTESATVLIKLAADKQCVIKENYLNDNQHKTDDNSKPKIRGTHSDTIASKIGSGKGVKHTPFPSCNTTMLV
jgi:hypothetical protein